MTDQPEVAKREEASSQPDRRSLGLVRQNGKTLRIPLLTSDVGAGFTSAFDLLSQNLEQMAHREGHKVILVIGAYPGDGRTTIVANLGIAMARNKQRVVLVDSDLSKPALEEIFKEGFQEGPMNGTQQKSYNNRVSLRKVGGMPLYVLTPENLTKVLSGSLVQSLRESFDFVFIDSAPFPGDADVFRLAALSDGVIYAIRSRSQDLTMLQDVKEHLGLLDVELLGAIYTDM